MFQRECVRCRCVHKAFVGDSLHSSAQWKHEFPVRAMRKERVEQEGGPEDLTFDHTKEIIDLDVHQSFACEDFRMA